jgi:ribosomal protein S18 acetylase RimI-like enzyme
MRELIARAGQEGRPLALRVLKGNLRARYLYQRLGFGVTGENDRHYIMAYFP